MFCTAEDSHQKVEFLLVVVNERFVVVLAMLLFHFALAVSCRELMFHHFLEEIVETE